LKDDEQSKEGMTNMILKWKRMLLALLLPACLLTVVSWGGPFIGNAYANGAIPAFPGAEGYGMYATGGRGGDVYEVTNLNDSGPGSFRDAVSQGNRTIVFRVSGHIQLQSVLTISSSNLTIAGQTAPGDGIAVIGHGVQIRNADNVIMRYMRFRLGDINNVEWDTFYLGDSTNIIIDHCSFLWGVDEVFSAYPNESVTVQWSLIGEALNNSVHSKGSHGFGGIWGSSTSYHHNLIVHNSDRNPRFMTYLEPPYPADRLIDFRNNVVYDWGTNTSHSGQGLDFNMINNYYKWGNSTQTARKNMIFTGGENSTAFINGNYMEGSPEVTADNSLGIRNPGPGVTFSTTEVARSAAYPATSIATHTAEQAYGLVLANAGAIVPKRDSSEARVVAQVYSRTGRLIDSQREVGGYAPLNGAAAPADSDHDGMPDAWETANGLNPNDASDRNGDIDNDGYTNLEHYLNSIASNGSNSPEVSLLSPGLDSLHTAGGSMTIQAAASDSDGTIAKVEFYANEVKLGESAQAPYSFTWNQIPEGTYSLTARAIDDSGTAASSPAHPVYINNAGSGSPWSSTDIGPVGIQGHSDVTDSVYTVKSAGAIRGGSDAFRYLYRPLEGNGEVIARVDAVTHTNEQAKAGIMLRERLTPDSRMAMIGLDLNAQRFNPSFFSRAATGGGIQSAVDESAVQLPYWLKLVRFGDKATAYVSADGANWTKQNETSFVTGAVYIGLVADPAQEATVRLKYNTSKFSNVSYSEISPVPEGPSGLQASRTTGDVRLSWDAVQGADSYTVKRSMLRGGPYQTVGTSVYPFYTDASVQPGINYFYVVHAVNEYGESIDFSNETNGALLGTDPLTYLLAEDFETATAGSLVPPHIAATPNNATNHLIVSAVPSGSSGNASAQAVELYDASSGQTAGNAAFPPQSGRFVAQADFMLPIRVTPIRALKIMDGSRAYVEILVYNGIGCTATPCFSYRASDGSYYALPSNHTYAANTWYTLKAVVDVPNETATIYINGLSAGTIPFYFGSGWTSPSSLGVMGASTASTAQTSVYWDNIRAGIYGLQAPSSVTASSRSGTVQLSWSAVAGAGSYNVYRLDPSLNRYTRIAANVTGTAYSDEGLANGVTQTYAIAAVRTETGEGEYSEPAQAVPGN
jgi:pectate lyase